MNHTEQFYRPLLNIMFDKEGGSAATRHLHCCLKPACPVAIFIIP